MSRKKATVFTNIVLQFMSVTSHKHVVELARSEGFASCRKYILGVGGIIRIHMIHFFSLFTLVIISLCSCKSWSMLSAS